MPNRNEMKRQILRWICKEEYNPGLWGIFLNPFFLLRRALWQSIERHAPRLHGRLLDVGCGSKPYLQLFNHVDEYVGMEFDSPANRVHSGADVFYSGEAFPFATSAFDSILSTEVLEHVFNPQQHLKECFRVLRPGGLMLLTTPFVWDEHSKPYDYGRYSSFGLSHVMNEAGFEVVDLTKTCANVGALCQLLNCYIGKVLPFKKYWLRTLVYCFLSAPITTAGCILGRLLPRNVDLYLSNVTLVRRPV